MITEWQQYWTKKAEEAERQAQRMEGYGYSELAENYRDQAQEIRSRFLADAVIVELSELELRYRDGDR